MAIQSNFPAIKPSLLLDFANTKQLDPRITFTRASTASYYDGVTTAMAEQNLILQSQDFSAWTTSEVTTSLNSTAAPDGTTTADTITPSTNVARHTVQQNFSSAGATYVYSIYAKPNGYNRITIRESSTSGNGSTFDVSTGTVVSNQVSGVGSITSVGSGWYRCSMVATETSGTRTMQVLVNSNSGSGYEAAFAGDGTSGVYLWGAQVEQRSAVSAYTATTTQAITNYIPKLQSAASGVARFDNNPTTGESLGLLIEEQRTNLQTYSADFSNAVWTKNSVTISSNTLIAPDGTLTADTLTATAGAAYHYANNATGITTSGSNTFSFYVKKGTATWIFFGVRDTSLNYFNLDTGAFGTTPDTCSVQSVGNSWYRISVTKTETLSTIPIGIAGSNGGATYTATGYETIFIWGAQLEAGAFATSYIPTVASQVTRSADAASMTGTNFSSWYSKGEGTIYAEAQLNYAPIGGGGGSFYSIDDTSASTNVIQPYFSNGSGILFSFIAVGGVEQANTGNTVISAGASFKHAQAYRVNDFASVVNGGTVSTDASGTIPVVTQLQFSNGRSKYYKKFAYYPLRVTNAQLQALTS